MPQLQCFLTTLQTKLANEGPYKAGISSIRLKLQELQKADSEVQKLRQQKANGYKKIDEILYYQSLPFVSKAIWTERISRHHNNSLASYFGIKKICKLLAWKYYWPTFHNNVKAYVKDCDICVASKAVRHKFYNNLQLLPISMHQWKDLLMDFVTGLPISINWKKNSYDSILVIVDWLTQMVYYKSVKITINALGLAEVRINMVVRYHGLPDSIVINWDSLFTSKFWSLLCYFLGIKRWLFTTFHLQTDGQIKRQNSTIEAYLQAFVNFEENNWARLLPMAEFAYNNAKNASIGHTPFELNCGYHFCISFKENTDLHSWSKTADELLTELQELMIICQKNLYHAQEL